MPPKLILGLIAILTFLLFTILQLCAGYVGIAYHLGALWAVVAVVLAVVFRFTLPITIGAFFGALNVWHWPFIFAVLFILPGLMMVVPGVLMLVISKLKNSTKPTEKNPKDVVLEADYTVISTQSGSDKKD